jgi:hypothetical protein
VGSEGLGQQPVTQTIGVLIVREAASLQYVGGVFPKRRQEVDQLYLGLFG